MADVNSNININFNTAAALAQLRSLQAGLSRFHQSLAEGNLAASNAQKGLNAQLLQSIGATGKFSASQVKVAGSTLAFTSALEKNKLSLREYYRYTMAAATANTRVMGKAFAQEREIINRARRDRVKALQAQYIQMNKSNSGFMDAIRVMPKSLAMANGKFTELGTRIQYAAQRQQFLNQLLKQGSTQLLNFGKNTQWAGRQLMVGLTMPLALFGSMAAKTFRELETEIIKFKRVYGNAFTNDAETDAAVANIRKLATEYTKYGVSVTKTVEMAATAAAAGFTGSALNAQVETATKLAVLGQIEQQQALETTISLQSAFGISSEELAKKIDFLNAVENQTLLSIEDLTIAIPKAAPVVKQLGGTVEDLAFFLTAMKEGGINASEGANALKSGLASLINPSDKAAKFMGALGINIKGLVEANKGDIKATVVGFARALDELDPLNRARAIEQMFGKFQFSRLSTLFQNVTKDGSQAARALDLAGSSIEELAVMSEREMKKIEDSVGVKFQAVVEKFKQDIMPLGKIFLEALTPVVKFFGDIFEKFNGLSDSTKKVIAIIVGAVAGLGPIVLMTFGLLANGIANVVKFFSMLRGGIAKLNGQTSVMGAGFNYMTQEQIENAASSQQLHQTHTRLIEVFNVEAGSVNALASSYSSLSTQMRAMASQNPALFAGGMGGAKRAVAKIPTTRKYKDGIISVPGPKGAGDVVPAMLSPGEAVIPTDTTDKYRGLITAMFQDKVPGFMAGRIPKGPAIPHRERQSGAVFVGMPKSAAEASQSRQILDKISNTVKSGRFGSTPPTDFGTLLQPFSGRSFPARGVGGVYRKPNGEVVVVKPTIDEKTALAEVRATQIAREVHGLVSPKQSIKTMLDPTDLSGQRKFVVIESPYDPRIAAMDGKFSKSDMVKQLVASTLRGDKDLQKANLSGNVLADVGTAGVFDKASGFRDFAKSMPSMEQQAIVNLLGVKGGARKDFAQSTSSIAAGMNPAQYDAAIKAEINKSIPRLEKLLKSWDKDLNPTEKIVYGNMLERLKAGKNTDWASLQPIHARASQGVKKAIDGIDPDASRSEMKKQISAYGFVLPEENSNQTKQIQKFIDEMDKEYSNHPDPTTKNQYVNNKTKWHDLVKQFKFNPDSQSFQLARTRDGSLTRPFTLEEAKAELRYAMKESTKNGDFSSRPQTPSTFRRALEGFGKGSTGSPSHVKTALGNIGKQNPSTETLSMKKVMDALKIKHNLSDKQLSKALRYEAAHIVPSGFAPHDPRNWQHGQVLSEFGVANNFLNTVKNPKNFEKLLNNPKTKLPVSEGGLGYDDAKIAQLKRDLFWASSNKHPTTSAEFAKLVRLAELNTLAAEAKMLSPAQMKSVYQAEAVVELGKIRKESGFFNDIHKRVIGLTATKETVRYSNEKEYLDAQKALGKKTGKDVVAARKGESVANKKARTVKKIGKNNSTPIPNNVVPIDKNGKRTSDNVLVRKRQSETVTTPSQTRQLIRVRGFEDGDPGAIARARQEALNPNYKKQELKKLATKYPTLDESQIQKILLRKLKADKALLDAKERELAIAKKAERRAEQLPKQEAARQAKLDKIENQRQSRLLEASRYQDKANKMNAKIDKERNVKQARMARQEKVGRFSGGASMALGTAGMGLMMAGQQNAGMAVMGASAVAGMAPMFAGMGPVGLALTAVAAVGGGLFLLNKHFENSAKKQAKYVESVSATINKMDQIGKITGKVGASRAMDEVRKRGSFGAYNDVERAGTGFGTTFLKSEVGKQMVGGFVEQMKSSGSETAAKDFALQLSAYVSDGVLNASQASDIADQIGIQLGSRKYTAEIMGNIRSIIGPNGEDILSNPLRVRMQIIQEADKRGSLVLKDVDSNTSISKQRQGAAQYAAIGVNNAEIAKAQVDATEFQYRKQIQLLEKSIETTTNAEKLLSIKEKISRLEIDMARDVSITNKAYADQIDKEVERFESKIRQNGLFGLWGSQVDDNKEDAYFDSLKSKVKDTFKGTEFETMAGTTLEKLAKLGDLTVNPLDGGKTKGGFENKEDAQSFEVKMSLLLANKVLNPEQLDTFLLMFQGNLPEMEQTLSIGMRTHGPGATIEMLEFFSTFDDEDGKIKEMAAKIVKSNPKQFNEIGEALSQLRVLDGQEINMEAYIKTVGYAGLVALSKDLAKIEAMPNKIDKELILNYFSTGEGSGVSGASKENLETLFAQWSDFDKLPDKAQKEAISKFISIYSTIFADEAAREKYAKDQAAAAVENSDLPSGDRREQVGIKRYEEVMSGTLDEAAVRESARATKNYIGENGELLSNPAGLLGDLNNGGKNNPLSFLDKLAMDLKQVRDNAFNALKPVESLLAAFKDKKTQQGAFALFDGIQNRLLKLGAGEGLRGAIESMSAEDFSKVAAYTGNKALFTFAKGKTRSKDTITGLTETGKAVDQGYKERDIGNFKLANDVAITGIKDQTTAYNMLISGGLSASEALDVVADKSQAAAIAAGTIKKGTKEWKDYVAGIKESNTALERQAVLNKAIRANEEFAMYKKMPKLVSQMKTFGYSTSQIDAVLGDPALAKELMTDLKDGKLDAEEIATFLNNIEKEKIVDIQVKLNKGDLAGAASAGRQIVDDYFAAEEELIMTSKEALDIKKNNVLIAGVEREIDPFLKQVADATEVVNDLNRSLEMNPLFGDRAIQKIQDENSSLSNDLTVISNAAEKVNKRYDDQAEALQKVSDINQNILDQQKQQIGLADAITSGDISAAARAVQEMRAGNASRFADAQRQALQQARENALGSLTGPKSGLTQDQINQKQYENSQRIYAMENDPARLILLKEIQAKQDEIYNTEENQIEPRQAIIDSYIEENKKSQEIIDKNIRNIKLYGDTKDAWDKINARLDYFAAAQAVADNPNALAGLLAAADTLKTKWDEILAKMSAYSKGVPVEVAGLKTTFLTVQTEAEKEAARVAAEIAKTAADEKIKQDAIKRTQGFRPTEIGRIERSLMFSGYSMGGLVPKYFASGGYAMGTDTVPSMLTPGEFVMSKYAVDKYGVENMKSINSGSSIGDSVYNYNLNLNVKSDANPDDIARAVMVQIKSVDAQRIRGARF